MADLPDGPPLPSRDRPTGRPKRTAGGAVRPTVRPSSLAPSKTAPDAAPSPGPARRRGPASGPTPKQRRPPSKRRASSRFRARYGVPYDTQGPKVRLGVLWALALVGSLVYHPLRPYALALLMAVVAGMAAGQLVGARRGDHGGSDRRVAELGASALPVLAALGSRQLAVGMVLVSIAAVVAATVWAEAGRNPFGRAALIAGSAALSGGVAGSVVLLAHYEIGAVVVLLTYVLLYDASDFVVGSGASNGIEGPVAGALIAIPVTAIFALLGVPPFHGADVWAFALMTVVACPAGQILASALLPSAATPAPALRRLDSLLVAAPLWAGLVGIYLNKVG